MSFCYFRFYFSEAQSDTQEEQAELLEGYQMILSWRKDLGFIRASLDLSDSNQSVSILCESHEDMVAQKNSWIRHLRQSGIRLKKKVEHEVLEDVPRLAFHCEAGQQHCTHELHDAGSPHEAQEQGESHRLKAAVGLLYGLGVLTLSVMSSSISMAAYQLVTLLSTLVTLYLGYHVYQSAWDALTQKKWEMSLLYTLSTLSIVGISMVSLFVPGLPMMLESAPLILGFWHLGEAIEHTLLDKINQKLDIRDCAAETVLLKDSSTRKVSVKQLIPNDRILVQKGEVLPVDGVLIQSASLYTTRVNGSPRLKQFHAGAPVKAGMSVSNELAEVEIRVTKTYQNSYLSLIAKNINKANLEKAPTELLANKMLKYFIPSLLFVAVVSGGVLGFFFPATVAIQCAISVLVSACPCVLSMIIPMAVKIGMKKASENGGHYKDGKALQAASEIDTIVFDLNGTLTEGEISVESMHIKDKALLKYFALLEEKSDHPVAKKIKSEIEKQGKIVEHPIEIVKLDKSHHSGVTGVMDGETWMIGNRDLLRSNGVELPVSADNQKSAVIYMVKGLEVVGQISLTDRIREDARATVKQLQRMGKQVHLCTGADLFSATRYARLLGISEQHICANAVGVASIARAHEISKESYIARLKAQGHQVAMVGDAANDLTAIARADLGIAVKSRIGDTLTEQQASMVVQQGLLFPIAIAFDVALKTQNNIFQNLFVSLTYNAVITLVAAGLFVAVGFTLHPVLGIALMVVESAVVLANLYRLKSQEILSPSSSLEKQEVEQTKQMSPIQQAREQPSRPMTKNVGGNLFSFFSQAHQENTIPSSCIESKALA